MMTSPKSPSPQGISAGYHYVITLQFEARNGVQQVSYETGVIFPDPGETRSDLFRRVFQSAVGRGISSNPVPLFFSLEPEDLIVTTGKATQ